MTAPPEEKKKAVKKAIEELQKATCDVQRATAIGTKLYTRSSDPLIKDRKTERINTESENVKNALQRTEAALNEMNHVAKYECTKDFAAPPCTMWVIHAHS